MNSPSSAHQMGGHATAGRVARAVDRAHRGSRRLFRLLGDHWRSRLRRMRRVQRPPEPPVRPGIAHGLHFSAYDPLRPDDEETSVGQPDRLIVPAMDHPGTPIRTDLAAHIVADSPRHFGGATLCSSAGGRERDAQRRAAVEDYCRTIWAPRAGTVSAGRARSGHIVTAQPPRRLALRS
jgi:hypothetical protein